MYPDYTLEGGDLPPPGFEPDPPSSTETQKETLNPKRNNVWVVGRGSAGVGLVERLHKEARRKTNTTFNEQQEALNLWVVGRLTWALAFTGIALIHRYGYIT